MTLHGRGQAPAFMRAVTDRVDLPDVAWVAPAADADSWYPLSFLAPVADNEPRLSYAVEVVDRTRERLAAEGFGPDRLALLGFSQGAVVLAEHLARGGARCAAAALLTGGHVDLATATARTRDLGAMPVLLGVAAEDALVPLARVRATAALLERLGAAVVLEAYDDREHLVSDRAVASTRALLTAAMT